MSKLSLRKKSDPKANKKITGFFRKEDKDELVGNETTVKSKSVLGNISNLPVKQDKFVVQSPEIIKNDSVQKGTPSVSPEQGVISAKSVWELFIGVKKVCDKICQKIAV